MKLLTLILTCVLAVLVAAADLDCTFCADKFNVCMELSGSWKLPNCDKVCDWRACYLDQNLCPQCGFKRCLPKPTARGLDSTTQTQSAFCAECVKLVEACVRDADGSLGADAEKECRVRVNAFEGGCREACRAEGIFGR